MVVIGCLFLLKRKDLLKKAFDSFKRITPALIAVALASGLILFLPEIVLEKMALNDLPANLKKTISVAFIVACALILTITAVELYRAITVKLAPYRFRKNKRKHYINLPREYKKLLITLLESEKRSIELDPTSGDTLYLLNNQFIHQAQSYMFVGVGYTAPVTYTPEPWLIDLYNKEPDLFKL